MTRWQNNIWCRLPLLAVLALPLGCDNGRYSVHGRVVYEDGSPLTEGIVAGEMDKGDETRVMARGNVASDGAFSWGTQRPGDGAEPGKYRVVVIPRAVSEYEASQGKLPDVDPKFSNPQTSGLDFEVTPGKNELNITVTKPPPKTPKVKR
jgi:hypothetical protein